MSENPIKCPDTLAARENWLHYSEAAKKTPPPIGNAYLEESDFMYLTAVVSSEYHAESGQLYPDLFRSFPLYHQQEFNGVLRELAQMSTALSELAPHFHASLDEVCPLEGAEPDNTILDFVENNDNFCSGMVLLNISTQHIVDFFKYAAFMSKEKEPPQFFCDFEHDDEEGKELAKSNLLQFYLLSSKFFLRCVCFSPLCFFLCEVGFSLPNFFSCPSLIHPNFFLLQNRRCVLSKRRRRTRFPLSQFFPRRYI